MKRLPLLQVRRPGTFLLQFGTQCSLRSPMHIGLRPRWDLCSDPKHTQMPFRWRPVQETLESIRALGCPSLALSAYAFLRVPSLSSLSNTSQLILLMPRDCANKARCAACIGRWKKQSAIAKNRCENKREKMCSKKHNNIQLTDELYLSSPHFFVFVFYI